MLNAVLPGVSAFSPEVGLHDADFFLDTRSLDAAAAVSWLLPASSESEV